MKKEIKKQKIEVLEQKRKYLKESAEEIEKEIKKLSPEKKPLTEVEKQIKENAIKIVNLLGGYGRDIDTTLLYKRRELENIKELLKKVNAELKKMN